MSDANSPFDPVSSTTSLATDLLSGIEPAAFAERARQLAAGMDVDDIEILRFRLHNPPPEPADYDFRKHGLGGWLSACQFAIFELIFQLGAEATPALREIAWGPYDWTQGNAIELLIRMAAEGIEVEETVAEIGEKFPGIRYEAKLYTLEPLLPRLATGPALAAFMERLRNEVPDLDHIAAEIEQRRKTI